MVDVCTLHSDKVSDGLAVNSVYAPDASTETRCDQVYITHSFV